MPERAYAEIVHRNAGRWEAMAKHRLGMPLDDHRAGISALEPEELELLGDLHGTRVLHLACAVCDEGITMAMLGATVVGVDISETHIRVGQEKANALDVDVALRVGDMMNLDVDLVDFDLVYISSGGICWVPDLDDWLVGVRNALKPDGCVLISEHHPFWEMMGVAGDRKLTVLSDYFGTHKLPTILDTSKAAIGAAETSESEYTLQSFVWGIGAVVSALLRHDFQIGALL
ncbi:MAG: class I SAM-dependent methyltransferase, partial [Rhodococcus sp. (in: high G+C Gram-positive bacteria)]